MDLTKPVTGESESGIDGPLVEAAGGLVIDEHRRLAIVHRGRQDDWSLPKGHLDPGESHVVAALREVREETGLTARIVASASETRYRDRKDRPKRVRYFVMVPESGTFEPNSEVDEIRWIEPADLDALSYDIDRSLAQRFWIDRYWAAT